MAIYTRLVSSLLFPLHERLKHHDTVAVRRDMEEVQWWPRERLMALQVERLRAFLKDVGVHVPYYRDLFARTGFDPDTVRSVEALQQLPLLDKAAIRAHTDALRHAQAQDLVRFNTGGSSGEPLVFYIGKRRVSHDVAAKWRATRWWGVDIGDPEIVVWGSPIELGKQDHLKQWRDRLLRTQLLPAFEMSEAKVDGFIATIRRVRPPMLFGYPSALSHIAKYARKKGQRMDDLGIRVAFVTSERLYDDQRRTISEVFGCRVANGYGGRDAGFIAHECPEGGMHITADDIVVETLDSEGRPTPPGVAGEIVVTHMATRDFPFVRYRTGDVGVLSTHNCACGRTLPLLGEIQGRNSDFVVAQDGTVIHGLALIYTLRDIPGVEAFKIVQESTDLTRVELVAGAACDVLAAQARIQKDFRRRLGEAVTVEVMQVAGIAAEKSGKFRYVQSKVPAAIGAQASQD